MARQPKDFRIGWVSPVEPQPPVGYLRTGPQTAVPMRFRASITLDEPQAAVALEVFIGADLRPRINELTIRANVRSPISTSLLRKILVDQLLREAVAKAEVDLSGLPEDAVVGAPPSIDSGRGKADADARTAATLYSQAVAAGSTSPGMVVARGMNRSRAQVARYLRLARQSGYLPERSPDGSP